MSKLDLVMVPLVVSSMPNEMGRAVGTRKVSYVAVGDRVSIRAVVRVMSFTVKAGPELKYPGMSSESALMIQANILVASTEVNLAHRKWGHCCCGKGRIPI